LNTHYQKLVGPLKTLKSGGFRETEFAKITENNVLLLMGIFLMLIEPFSGICECFRQQQREGRDLLQQNSRHHPSPGIISLKMVFLLLIIFLSQSC
jgi:hypothetical protein